MKHLTTIIVLIILLTGCAHHKDRKPWDGWDKALYVSLLGGVVADIASTDYNTNNGFEEQNPVCGDGKPETTIPINIAVLIAGYYIADYLPPTPRKWFLGVSSVLRWGTAGVNYNASH